MRRDRNFRSGDRAEAFGALLLQSFCAVALVPRSEDFGLFDAVATVLRPEGRLVYAEETFLVQFKSRTVKSICYEHEKLLALRSSHLSLFIARVDMTKTEVELFSLTRALSHPNISDRTRLTVHLDPHGFTLEKGIMETYLGPPILRLNATDLENWDVQAANYHVIRDWLEIEGKNRSGVPFGVQQQVCWETNKPPLEGGTSLSWRPDKASEVLANLEPFTRFLSMMAFAESDLIEPTLVIFEWMAKNGYNPDESGTLLIRYITKLGEKRLSKVLESHDEADIGIAFTVIPCAPDKIVFWETQSGGCSKKHTFDCEADVASAGYLTQANGSEYAIVGVTDKFLSDRNLKLIHAEDNIVLFKRTDASTA